jgi:hypothetical protein
MPVVSRRVRTFRMIYLKGIFINNEKEKNQALKDRRRDEIHTS